MLASAVLALWFGREVSFSIDEYSWIALSARFGLGEAFAPYVGHLIAIPRLVYWAALETVGNEHYWVFQILTLISLFVMIGLLFTWLRKRTGDLVALAPCLILLIFPVDHLHYLTGNGMVISLALAFGIGALLAWERNDVIGDIGAFVLLLLGMMTYTVAVPFAIGLIVAAVVQRAPARAWVGGLPIILFLIWRLLEGSGGVPSETGSIEWDNLLLIPAWTFQSLGAILASMTGLGFDFSNPAGGPALEQGALIGPVLAVLGLIGLAWRWRLGPLPSGLWVALAILLALFSSQALVWGTLDARNPGAPRYLLPGAVLLVLVIGELLRNVRLDRIALGALWVVTAASLSISVGILASSIGWLETTDSSARAEVTAVEVLETSRGDLLPPARQPRDSIRSEYDAAGAASYGYLGFTSEGIDGRPGWVGAKVDRFLVQSLGIGLSPLAPGLTPTGCRPAERVPGSRPPQAEVPSPGAVIRSTEPVSIWLGRFGAWPSTPLGVVRPDEPRKLLLPFDEGIPLDGRRRDWYIQARKEQPGFLEDVELCALAPNQGGPGL
jgi:hypothetical protein